MTQFASRPDGWGQQDMQNRRLDRLARECRLLDRKRAVQLAAGILAGVLEDGVTYADFQSAQHAEKAIRAAAKQASSAS